MAYVNKICKESNQIQLDDGDQMVNIHKCKLKHTELSLYYFIPKSPSVNAAIGLKQT